MPQGPSWLEHSSNRCLKSRAPGPGRCHRDIDKQSLPARYNPPKTRHRLSPMAIAPASILGRCVGTRDKVVLNSVAGGSSLFVGGAVPWDLDALGQQQQLESSETCELAAVGASVIWSLTTAPRNAPADAWPRHQPVEPTVFGSCLEALIHATTE
ncbi:hypothetical protein LZ30DRAFT_693771 [Colletotrichum cereale]|nr:hypothetical protein LZ30DRAFT_693771 [Colletotrichum cereale]